MAKLDNLTAGPFCCVDDAPPRRAEIVAALRAGLITREQAMADYGLSPEEIAVWERTFDSLGLRRGRKLSRQT